MRPQPGDKSLHVTRRDVTDALHDLDIGPGDVLMFHSSLTSLGHVDDGPDAVIDGMLDALAPGGTLVAPTLCQKDKERRFETWDLATSPSDVGLLTETLRQRPDALRSDHATHSVAALGPRAEELTRDHANAGPRRSPWGPRAFGHSSPWDKFYAWNIHYLFVGVDFRVNTMRHYIQSVVVERALDGADAARRDDLASQVREWQRDGVWPDYPPEQMEEHLDGLGLVRYGTMGSATTRLTRARGMVDAALATLEGNPGRWFGDEFVGWLHRCRKPTGSWTTVGQAVVEHARAEAQRLGTVRDATGRALEERRERS